MDAAQSSAGLIEEFNRFVEAGDFEGAEEILLGSVGQAPVRYQAFFHFQLGRLYVRWKKLTSAVNHFNLAAELAHRVKDELMLMQVIEELKSTRNQQAGQKP